MHKTECFMHSLSPLPKIFAQFSVSDGAGASIAFAVLKDYGIINEQNKELIIDRSKVRRKRKKERSPNQSFQKHHQVCRGYILMEKKTAH